MPTTRRALAWAHGCLSVQSLGAMLGPVLFILPDGRQISPFHIAPWGNDPDRHILPPILRELRGEWPCVPFGSDGPRALPSGWNASGETFNGADVPHGYSSNAHWDWGDCDDSRITLQCEYPAEHPVSSVRRCITPDPAAAAIDITLEVRVRRTCNLPVGLHPTFRLSPRTGSVEIEPGIHGAVRSFPGDVEPGATLFAKDASWPALQGVTTREGKPVDAARVPFACQAEDLLQLTDIGGSLALHYRDEGFRVQLHWQKEHFPSVLLWYSNRGRKAYPWNGNHLALGVEPVCAAFDLGPGISAASNPINRAGTATSITFHPDDAFITRYRISVEAICCTDAVK